mmetsp:Transcript_10466/g.20063  ORF Transcript_10466/g.20063 Transcript_10466/m.20063 type:complete len:174 (+) Transcript_10466:1278-1799(+)
MMMPASNFTFPRVGAQLDIEIKLDLKRNIELGVLFLEGKPHSQAAWWVFGIKALLGDPKDEEDSLDIRVVTLNGNIKVYHNDHAMQVNMYDEDNGFLTLRILVDRSVSETFVQGGRMVKTTAHCSKNYKKLDSSALKIHCMGDGKHGGVDLVSFKVWSMENANGHMRLMRTSF